ncbi:hypothetical protein O3P69_009238 [Scylla paramamosain]|uniref:Uncharacterized protein n=1 Tax=Scylla paramamosain TaxID=85552 RepID=A0AAW0TAV3_SCYPA
MPPSYDVAVNDASSSLFGMWGCHRPWRRPSVPQERDQTPPSPRVPVYGGTPPLEPRHPHPSSQLTGEEVEKVEEGGDVDFFSTQEEDVPLLTNLVEGGYHGDEERRQQEEEEEVVEEEEEEEEEADDVPLLLDLISTSSTSISSSTFELDSDEEITNKRQEDVLVEITRHPTHLQPEPNPPHHSRGDDGSPAPPPPSSVFPEGGDVLSDTRAAVLALSAVQSHMDSITHSDTELISQMPRGTQGGGKDLKDSLFILTLIS